MWAALAAGCGQVVATDENRQACAEPALYRFDHGWGRPLPTREGWYTLELTQLWPARLNPEVDQQSQGLAGASGLLARWIAPCTGLAELEVALVHRSADHAGSAELQVYRRRLAEPEPELIARYLTGEPGSPHRFAPVRVQVHRGEALEIGLAPFSATAARPQLRASVRLEPHSDPPSVTVVAPIHQTKYCEDESLWLVAQATDADGSVEAVEFLVNGSVRSSVRSGPFHVELGRLSLGTHTLQARAIDNHGRSSLSSPVVIEVVPRGQCHSGPLRVSGTGRYFEDRHGRPFLWLGDTQWPLFSGDRPEQAVAILRDRRLKGFTVVQVMAVWPGWDEGSPPAPYRFGQPNRSGHFPLIQGDSTRLNDAYWEALKPILDAARDQDMTIGWVLISGHDYISPPACQGGVGELIRNEEQARSFAQAVAQRFRSWPNIVWILGGDALLCDKATIYQAMYAGIREVDAEHPVIFHPSTDWPWHGGTTLDPRWNPWGRGEQVLDAWSIQSGPHLDELVPLIRAAYRASPVKPVLHLEGAYEGAVYNEGSLARTLVTPLLARQQAWLAYLNGAFHTYGHDASWRRGEGWQAKLHAPGAQQMGVLRSILARLDWHKLAPVEDLVVASTFQGPVPAVSARHQSGGLALVYLPEPGAVTVDLGRVGSGRIVEARWIDPRNGLGLPGGRHLAGAREVFGTPSGWEDALLVLESVAERPAGQAVRRPVPPGGSR